MRVALLTPPGRGALAVVGIAGPGAGAVVARLFVPRGTAAVADRPAGTPVFGRWASQAAGPGQAARPGEDLVVIRRGEETFEAHCHGGLAASEAVIASLENLGVVRQAWPEWLRSGGMPEVEVEVRETLAVVGGPKAARILARQFAGLLVADLERVQGQVAGRQMAEAAATLDRLRRAARVGLRLERPWRVVVAGSVNAGKSSLVNALAGHARAIVSPEPGTTRDLLETRVVLDGWEVDLVDTAGLRETVATMDAVTSVEREGIARASEACETADLVLRVIEGGQINAAGSTAAHELLVASKADRTDEAGRDRAPHAIWTSVVTGEGIGELAAAITRRLVPEEADDPGLLVGAVPFTERQMTLVNEQWEHVFQRAQAPPKTRTR
jgi:tRNA modification GTPase